MEKVSAAPIPKPVSQPENAEISQRLEEQERLAMVESVYDQGAVFSDGRGFDLTGVPAQSGREEREEEVQERSEGREEVGGDHRVREENGGEVRTGVEGRDEVGTDQRMAVRAGLIVEDLGMKVQAGQMKKTEFMERLRAGIIQAIEPVLARVDQTTDGCPYLNYWLGLYSGKEAEHIERTVRKYAPESVRARTAEEYIELVVKRALRAAETWAMTGRLTGVPEGVPVKFPEGVRVTLPVGGQAGVGSRNKGDETSGRLVQAKAKSGGVRGTDDPHGIREELGEGQPLAGEVRSRMEPVFGMSFSHVRTHTDSAAAGISDRVNARAFTVGSHVAFGSGEYRPGTMLGDALIAHELAHTIQQRGAGGMEEGALEMDKMGEGGGMGYDNLERDADRTAIGVTSALWKRRGRGGAEKASSGLTNLRSGLRLQRCGKSQAGVGELGADNSLWYFGGETQAGFTTTARVRVQGYTNAADVRWQISRGADKVEFDGASTGAEVLVRGKAGSATAHDVQLDAAEGGTNLLHLPVTVRKPHKLETVGTPNDQGSCPAWVSGCHPPVWYTRMTYRIKDNLNDTLSNVDVNEHFPGTKTDDVPNNWTSPAGFSTTPHWSPSSTSGGTFVDNWFVSGGNPSPVAPTAPNAGSSVDRLPHEFYVGSATPANGCRVQSHTAHRYLGYARHEGITTPAP